MHADRANRVVLSLIGLIALGLGVAGLLASGGVFGSTFQHRQLTDNQFARYFGKNGSWLWPTIGAAAFVIMLLTLIWLLRLLFHTDRAGDITIRAAAPKRDTAPGYDSNSSNPGPAVTSGRTTLRPGALTQALANEIETYHGVNAARARVLGDPLEPTLAIDVTAHRRADLAELVRRIEHEALAHARQALDKPQLPVKVDITVTDRGPARSS